MWLYRTVESVQKEQILLYEYQKTRNSNHPRTFLKSFHGICITDGYQVYHTLEQEREDLQIAGCWAHVRRRYDEALKALPKEKRNQSTAHRGLVMIQAIYRNEKPLKELSAEERRGTPPTQRKTAGGGLFYVGSCDDRARLCLKANSGKD